MSDTTKLTSRFQLRFRMGALRLVKIDRERVGREASPSAAVIDSRIRELMARNPRLAAIIEPARRSGLLGRLRVQRHRIAGSCPRAVGVVARAR